MNKHSATDLEETRFQKLHRFTQEFYDPYQQEFEPTHLSCDVKTPSDEFYQLTGRIQARRTMGKAAFLDLQDRAGKMQLYFSLGGGKEEEVSAGKKLFALLKLLDLGDLIGVTGTSFLTRRQEKTIQIKQLVLLAKCLHPIPVVKESQGIVYDDFRDHETKYRKRYLDLMISAQVRKDFQMRSQIIQRIRTFLLDRDFLEVETPMLQPNSGGAVATPFTTQHKALDIPLYLRIAPELYLKQLIVGEFHKVFELNRNFRNEGISLKHNPEFTMLELYVSYSNMEGVMALFEEMIFYASQCVSKDGCIDYQGKTVSFKPPWRRLDYLQAIEEKSGISIDMEKQDYLGLKREVTQKLNVSEEGLKGAKTFWHLVELIFDETVEKELIDPVLIVNHPKAISPFAKGWVDRPFLTARFEPYVMGREIGNGFSELNDPLEQYRRFVQQKKEHPDSIIDEHYVGALEYGMPPTGGLGVGIDRLVMLLLNKANIRDTILFPLLRPLSNAPSCLSKEYAKNIKNAENS